ncbi:hypothetical protein LIPSTDRAFT_67755 [Lipomyces starkeyi NRRL Y-11557]|uniref:Uncharacterized protein n=1 Tax=Lipomyces starkeyi NRRL Y-11557 TaxID=675824 RepID=A0A1E3QGK7_LIPST|nr:hypothetical protein LIPSTDRAFT_67755 [Lipomyces starkeyi NRRL Y-11557]
MCPSCFGCSDVEIREDRPTISIDGNFQQVHAKDVSPIAEAEPEYLFMDPTKAETRNIAANTCASNFKAPQTKAGDALFDAQGLMGVVCRHGNPLFCRNLFTKGEPFGDVLQIIKQVVQNYPTATKWGVTYDVGCALESALTVCPTT